MEDKEMESIRGKIVGFAKMQGKEDVFIARALGTLIVLLKKIPEDKEYEFKCGVSSLLSEFSVVFMAALAVMRSGRPLQEITQIEEPLQKNTKDTQVHFIERLLAPLCLQANVVAIEIAAFFLYANHQDMTKCARAVLEKAGRDPRAKSAVAEILQSFIPRKVHALSILAKVDAEIAANRAIELMESKKDEEILHEALVVLAESPPNQKIADRFTAFLKSHESRSLWKEICYRENFCDFIKRAFKSELISKEEATGLIAKAFGYERLNRGLRHILATAEAVDPKNKQLLLSGFLAMEGKDNYSFSSRKESVKKFVSGLKKQELVDYLRKSLLASNDREFCWFAGQYLIAADVNAAVQTFIEAVRAKKVPREKIGTLAQLAMKACLDDRTSGKWDANGLNKRPKSRFAPVARALLDYAESDSCPTEVRLAVAYQPGMYGGTVDSCRRAIPLLGRVIFDKKASPKQVREALRAILNTRLKKGLAQEIDGILKKIYESPRKKIFLEQMLFIMTNDIRGYPMEPLYPAIVGFLANNAKEADAVSILKKALSSEKPDGDLGMCARRTYILALKQIALGGNKQAVSAISEYRKNGTWHELIPNTLADIYQKTASLEIKAEASLGVAERFRYSIGQPSGSGVFYLCELKAVEALKEEPLVQKAFLEGIAAIADIGNYRSLGMCGIVEKTFMILSGERVANGRKTLDQLLKKLRSEKEAHFAECKEKKMCPWEDYIKTIDAISAETVLALATM